MLNISNNDLGDEAIKHLKPVFNSLVSLNISNTKLGVKGCIELS